MNRFQTGGLAAVTPPPDTEMEEEDTTVGEQVAEAVVPDPLAELRGMAKTTKETALAQLRTAQGEFQQRRARQNKRAEQDRWLAFAQAMLAPTKTGAFGESLGTAAGLLREQSAAQGEMEALHAAEEQRFMDRERAIAGDYFDALTNLEGFKNNSRARVVGTTTVIAPDQLDAIANGDITEAEADRNIVSIIMNPDGTTVSRVERDEQDRPWRIVDPRRVPSQAAAQRVAEVTATAATNNAVESAKLGIQAMPAVARLRRAYNLLNTLDEDTSGLQEAMRRVAQWAGISEVIDDNVTLAQLHRMFGDQVLADLRLLTGTKTDFEYRKMEELNAGLGKSIPENLAILQEGMTKMGEVIDRGEFAAQHLEAGPGTEERDFWVQQYVKFREETAKEAAERAAQIEEEKVTATPQQALDILMQQMQQNQGNQQRQREIIQLFRQRGWEIPQEMIVPLRELGAPL